MSRTLRTLVIIVLCLFPLTVSANDFLVAYSDGMVEYRDGDGWYELFIGDQIPASAQIRLGVDAFVELAGATTIQISQAGTYSLSDLATAIVPVRSAASSGRVSRLVSRRTPDSRTTVAGGVRASEAVAQSETLWAGDLNAMALIDQGLEKLDAADYQSAYWLFEEAYDSAQANEEAMVGFYFGFSAAIIGKTGEALSLLKRYPAEPDADYYDDHVLTLARLQVQTMAYNDALDILESYLDVHRGDDALAQEAYYLTGIAFRGLDRRAEAIDALNRAFAMDGGSELAALAREELAEL